MSQPAAPSRPVSAPSQPAVPTRRAPGVALLFEGGGMRASYTSGTLVTLLEQGVGFDFVGGVSAGSSNSVNYLHGTADRARMSFTTLACDPNFGSWRTLVRGKGFFNARWIYQEACLPTGPIPYDFEAFSSHTSQVAIQAFDRDSGASVVWHKEDIPTLGDLMVRVQASSSLPFFMPATRIDGRTYYDGGLGEGGGIPLHLAQQAGYERFFVVLTRPRGYRKEAPGVQARLVANLFARYPYVQEALLTRHIRYNEALDKLEDLADEGKACVVYADQMAVSSTTTNIDALQHSYAAGYAQAQRELPRWFDWLGV